MSHEFLLWGDQCASLLQLREVAVPCIILFLLDEMPSFWPCGLSLVKIQLFTMSLD